MNRLKVFAGYIKWTTKDGGSIITAPVVITANSKDEARGKGLAKAEEDEDFGSNSFCDLVEVLPSMFEMEK